MAAMAGKEATKYEKISCHWTVVPLGAGLARLAGSPDE
jgi:hypothetical protein